LALSYQVQWVAAGEGSAHREHNVKYDAEGPHVNRDIIGLPSELQRGEQVRGRESGAGAKSEGQEPRVRGRKSASSRIRRAGSQEGGREGERRRERERERERKSCFERRAQPSPLL
jgi:hypothetical protein